MREDIDDRFRETGKPFSATVHKAVDREIKIFERKSLKKKEA